jgi:hypothetical protein
VGEGNEPGPAVKAPAWEWRENSFRWPLGHTKIVNEEEIFNECGIDIWQYEQPRLLNPMRPSQSFSLRSYLFRNHFLVHACASASVHDVSEPAGLVPWTNKRDNTF